MKMRRKKKGKSAYKESREESLRVLKVPEVKAGEIYDLPGFGRLKILCLTDNKEDAICFNENTQKNCVIFLGMFSQAQKMHVAGKK